MMPEDCESTDWCDSPHSSGSKEKVKNMYIYFDFTLWNILLVHTNSAPMVQTGTRLLCQLKQSGNFFPHYLPNFWNNAN